MDISQIANILTARAEELTPDVPVDGPVLSAANASTPLLHRLTDIETAPLTWIWPGWIPAATLTILGGHVGDGKSTAIAALVAALTTGNELPDGTTSPRANVLILSAEDDPARVIRPRLEANGADLDRVFILDATTGPGLALRSTDLHRDAAHLREIILAHNITLIVIDSLGSFLRSSDRASEGALRDALQPLMSVIADTGVAVLGVMRVGKTGLNRRPAQRLVGSSAVPAIARSVIMIARASDEADNTSGRAILEVVKSNYVQPPPPVALRMGADGTVAWLGAANAGIDETAGNAVDPRLARSEREEAADFLREYLAEESTNAITVLKQAKDLGFSEITIRRAKKDIGVESYRDEMFRGFWMWRLPKTSKRPAQARRKAVAK